MISPWTEEGGFADAHLRLLALTLFLLPVVWGCASHPKAETSKGHLFCPPPLSWTDGERRPVRLLLTNATSRKLSVYLDQCDGHIRLGVAPPGGTAGFRLPEKLVPFNGQLHVHLSDPDTRTFFGSFAVSISDDWSLSLTVDGETSQAEKTYDPEAVAPQAVGGLAGFHILPGRVLSYASKWADGRGSVLSWICSGGEPVLTLSTGRTDVDELEVTASFDEAEERFRGKWAVVHGRSDNLSAPASLLSPFTLAGLESSSVQIVVEAEGGPEKHRFGLGGLASALEALPCFPRH